jgi:hypothetical protein
MDGGIDSEYEDGNFGKLVFGITLGWRDNMNCEGVLKRWPL